MAYSTRTYTPGSSTTTFALTTSGGDPIGYIQESDISVKVNGTTYTNAASGSNTYQISGTSTVEQPNGGNVVLNAGVTGTVILERTTSIQDATVVYTAGSTLTSTDLNNADNQIRFGLQEFSDDYAAILGTGTLTSLGAFIGGSDTWVSNDSKAATTAAIDNRVDAKATAKVKDDIIATAPVAIADDSPSAGKITVSVDAKLTELATMAQNTADSLADLTQAEVQILDGATISTTELNRLTGATSDIQAQLNTRQPLATDLTTLSSMQSGAATELASLTSTELEILDGATVTTNELNILDGVTATTAELNIMDGVTATTAELNLLDGVTATTAELNYTDGVTSAIQTQIDGKQASGSYQPLDSDLTTLAGMHSTTASTLSANLALNSTITELNQLDGITLGETSLTTNSNVAIPTSKAVNDRILTVTNALGGFVAIDNETSFPNTHPDPGGDAGTVVSIADVGGLVVNASGVATNAATVGGTAVTINGIATNFRGTTMTSGVGMQVQTTSTLNTYDYHTAILRDEDISSISTDIEDFGNRYRVGDNDPGSANDEGDLFFNKTSNTMKVYDGSAWGAVTSIGDFKFLFLCPKNGGSGAPTFNGSEKEFDLRETSNSGTGASITSAAQLTISVNGVVQKPNAGTNESGLDGFVLADANTIKFCEAPVSGDEVFVIQSGSAVTLNAPANNTVATDTLQSQAVTEAKILISNNPADGKFLQYKDSSDKLTWADVPAGVGGANGVDFNDDVKARFGTGNDLEIYHDGSNSYIKDTGTGALRINASSISFNNPGGTEAIAGFAENGAVELFYDNVKKFETVTGGVTITGNLEPEADNTRDLGSSSKRWANVYVGDMQLSNEGAYNDVDGTWGAYTLQEGEDDLFLINRRSGKKYKFNLTEVS